VRLPSGSFSLKDITYGNGTYVAVGGSGTTQTSPDGLSWSVIDHGDDWFEGVAFGNGVFVAVGPRGKIFTSTDGLVWHEKDVQGSYLKDILFAAGKFVAVGWTGTILTSRNGTSWAKASISPESYTDFEAVAYGDGLFVAVSDSGYTATSANGTSWDLEFSDFPGLQALTFGNNSFMAAGETGSILQAGPACDAVLSSNLTLHIPYVRYGTAALWADFVPVVEGGTVFFRLSQAGVHEDRSPYTGCSGTELTGDLQLSVDTLLYEDFSLWVDLAWAGDLRFRITGAGAK
jgi:hypothetical protein